MSHAIPVGARVGITGLVKQPQLNGEHGRVVGYVDAKQRYVVQLGARPLPTMGEVGVSVRECVRARVCARRVRKCV